MSLRLFAFLVGATFVSGLRGQTIGNELIVYRPASAVDPKMADDQVAERRELAPGIYHYVYADDRAAAAARITLRKRYPAWRIDYNYQVGFRKEPDDPDYFRQGNLARAGFEAAWETTTGGRTADGEEIVVAILDDGFDTGHPDLLANVWVNVGEIPDDGVDNDANGYVDDRRGWNFVDDTPDHPAATHGTSVAGIIGAAGDNGIGVAGANWSVRLMLFTINTVADIIAAYQYVIEQRSRYNATDGRSGSFIVATNASFGVEGATCDDFPAWGAMYDRMGAVGVLTAASVVNVGKNVDTDGDMPVDCPSDALLGVTNLGPDDQRFPSAGYGRGHVDLAAPGEESYTTRPGGRYGSFGSTSAAAPYVTGAIALLYASPDCSLLSGSARKEPAATAAKVRRAVLTSVRAIPSLANTTATGGSLDAEAARRALSATCDSPQAPFAVERIYPVPALGSVTVLTRGTPLTADTRVQITDVLGRRYPAAPVTLLSDSRLYVDLSFVPSGWYYLSVVNAEERGGQTILVHGR